MNEADLAETSLLRRVNVLLDDGLDVARFERVEIEAGFDRNAMRNPDRLTAPNCKRSLLGFGVGIWDLGFFLRVGRGDDSLDAAADGKIADDRHAARLACGHQVVEDLVGDRLVEDAAVAELDHVVLQRFQLDAAIAGHIGDADFAEVGEAGLRAERGELGTVDRDLEVAFGPGIGKCLERRRCLTWIRILAFAPKHAIPRHVSLTPLRARDSITTLF